LLNVLALSRGSGAAAFTFSGGTLQAGSDFSSSLPMTLSAGNGATVDTGGYLVTLSGSLAGPGSLIKAGSDTLVLSGSNMYAGGTLVTAGVLGVTNPSALLDGSSLTVNASGKFIFGGSEAAGTAGSRSAMPEPSVLALLGAGTAVLAAQAWRRRRESIPRSNRPGAKVAITPGSTCPRARPHTLSQRHGFTALNRQSTSASQSPAGPCR
jgi:autotransporter-associated beta strand protein